MTQTSPTTMPSSGWSERGISVLNGVVGDYLDRRGNGLAIPLCFVHGGKPLALEAHAMKFAQPAPSRRVVVLVHGWCCNEDVWRFADGDTYARKLQRDAGFTPFAVRYNTGMPVAASGKLLDTHLSALVAAYPCSIDEIVLIGHSMGGLVIRAACEAALSADTDWLGKVSHVFYLGTPHNGADLERFAQGATVALAGTRNPVTRLVGRVLGARSAGVRDLHDGGAAMTGTLVRAWLTSAQHHLLVGTLTDNPRHPVSKMLGDGLVRVPAPAVAGTTNGLQPAVTVFPGVHHLQLARDNGIYAAILATVAAS